MASFTADCKELSNKRLSKLVGQLRIHPVSAESDYTAQYRQKLRLLRDELRDFIDKINCNPILVRLAWHDSATYDRTIGVSNFPLCGGANGSIRFASELRHGGNAGLQKAINYLKPFKQKYPEISWSDLMQLASVTAIEHSGGPLIPIRFGRIDTTSESECPKEGNLPDAEPPFAGGRDPDAATHLRRVFYRMGFNDQEIVALSGAHTLGRAFKERSGTVKEGYGSRNGTQYTRDTNIARNDNRSGVGMAGGRSWTKKWLSFDKAYYDDIPSGNAQLLQLSTDKVLWIDAEFKKYAQQYAKDQNKFFEDYVKAHVKLSECGSKFRPARFLFVILLTK